VEEQMKITPKLLREIGFKEIKRCQGYIWYFSDSSIKLIDSFQIDLRKTKTLKALIKDITQYYKGLGEVHIIKEIKNTLRIREG
jgi:hypothetical protein